MKAAIMLALLLVSAGLSERPPDTPEACAHTDYSHVFTREFRIPYAPYNPNDHHVRYETWARCDDCREAFFTGGYTTGNEAHAWNEGVCALCGEGERRE
ncbi:hypothetical protein LJC74_08770 [Eubacteriales bacterium OttesenSCG-928-A19]|nr:hypothetical protein [Eubacteriales bacterium OttesenSCG-928-A19]